jgi:hypothetical protein
MEGFNQAPERERALQGVVQERRHCGVTVAAHADRWRFVRTRQIGVDTDTGDKDEYRDFESA